jgi:hypothetical protein
MHETLIAIPRGDQMQERWSELCNYHWSITYNLWYPREFNTRVGPFIPTQYQFYVIYIYIYILQLILCPYFGIHDNQHFILGNLESWHVLNKIILCSNIINLGW